MIGKFENKNILDLKRIEILEHNDFKNSKGFSYPFVISIEKNKIILFLPNENEEKKIIKNRLCFSNLENNNDRFFISDIKNMVVNLIMLAQLELSHQLKIKKVVFLFRFC